MKICSPITQKGFTLIELSIVLVIIGLLVGGILTGRYLISDARVKAQISQIDQYDTAANTFRSKYGYLPGDIPDPYATEFGFSPRNPYAGAGDGNGIVTGIDCTTPHCDDGNIEAAGETAVFWVDLSKAKLIHGGFDTAVAVSPSPSADITGNAIASYLPKAKIGQGNYVYVWAGGTYNGSWVYNGINYYAISVVTNIAASSNWGKPTSTAGISVAQAYDIDKKMDDGLPQSGSVTAKYLGVYLTWIGDPVWSDGGNELYTPPSTAAIQGTATTCYDNGNVSGVAQKYSVEINGGSGVNCGLSIAFQ